MNITLALHHRPVLIIPGGLWLPPSLTHTHLHTAVCIVLSLADLGRKDVLFGNCRSDSSFQTRWSAIRDGAVIFEIHVISLLPRSDQRFF